MLILVAILITFFQGSAIISSVHTRGVDNLSNQTETKSMTVMLNSHYMVPDLTSAQETSYPWPQQAQ